MIRPPLASRKPDASFANPAVPAKNPASTSFFCTIVVLVVMWAVASPYYMGMRKALEERGPDGRPVIEPAALARMLDSRRPEILTAVGSIGLVLLVWLMVIKPG